MTDAVLSASDSSCPLCGCDGAETISSIAFRDLRKLWFETSEIDIVNCLDVAYGAAEVPLRRCRSCALEFFPPALQGNARLYEELGRGSAYYTAERWEFDRALQEIRAAARLLEIGCGTGEFLAKVRERLPAAALRGTELNEDAVRAARARGFDVDCASVEQLAGAEPASFDIVCGFQLLEHVSNPGQLLRGIVRLLAPGGTAIVGVPDSEGFARFAVNDFGNLPPHHLTRWRAAVFERVGPRLGLSVRGVFHEPVASYHRDWHRTIRLTHAVGRLAGRRWRAVELGAGYRAIVSIASRLQRFLPVQWIGRGDTGHTMLVVLSKNAESAGGAA